MQRAALSAFVVGVLIVVLAACTGGPPTPTPATSSNVVPSASPVTEPTGPAPTSTPTSTASAPASEGVFPATMLGLPVLTVADVDKALAAGELDGHFAAVGGYWRQYALPCPFQPHQAVIGGFCSGGQFADAAADVDTCCGSVNGGTVPLAVPETLNGDQLWSASSQSAARVVLIVHAGDSRAWQCAPDPQNDCHTHLVIDDVAWVNGSATATGAVISETGVQPTMTLDQVAAAAVKSGEQLVTEYALSATHLNGVDPRFMGKGSGIVWLVRTTTAADAGGDGSVRLISDADGSVIEELALKVAADYNPARLVLDSDFSGSADSSYPHFTVLAGTSTIAEDQLGMATTPVTLESGAYVLHALMADADGKAIASGPTCDDPITPATGADVAYKASFSASTCSWAPFDPTQF